MARVGQRGQGRGGCESCDVSFVFSFLSSFSFSSILCCWQQGWKEEEEEERGEERCNCFTVFVSSAIGVVVMLDQLHHYLDGTYSWSLATLVTL